MAEKPKVGEGSFGRWLNRGLDELGTATKATPDANHVYGGNVFASGGPTQQAPEQQQEQGKGPEAQPEPQAEPPKDRGMER